VVCAIDHAPRAWSDAQLALLQRLAAIAARELERRHLDLQLATATAALCDQHDLMTAVIDSMDESVVVVDPAGQLMLVNRAAEQTFGPAAVIDVMTRAPTEVPAVLGLLDVDGVTPRDPARTPMQRALAGEVVRGCELVVRAPATGAPRWRSVNAAPIRAGRWPGPRRGRGGRDVTAIKEAQRALERSATRDALTGLYNRRGVHEHAQLALLRAERSGRPLALMFLDLDGLKVINDRLGHAAGDAALRRLAELLRATFRASDVVGRLGGDEFVVVGRRHRRRSRRRPPARAPRRRARRPRARRRAAAGRQRRRRRPRSPPRRPHPRRAARRRRRPHVRRQARPPRRAPGRGVAHPARVSARAIPAPRARRGAM
jgi:GGDEF domain-containing protein